MTCMFISSDIIPVLSKVLYKLPTERMSLTGNDAYNYSGNGDTTTEAYSSLSYNTGNDGHEDDIYPDEVFHSQNIQDDNCSNSESLLKDSDDEDTSNSETDSEYAGSSLDLRMRELKEFRCQNDDAKSNTCLPEDTHVLARTDINTVKNRLRLVKAYADIKEEMTKTTASNIANHLYQHRDKPLSGPAYENIHTPNATRPNTVEKLLKRVLMGPDVAYCVLITTLRQEDECLADLLDSIQPTDDDMKVFLAHEKKAESTKQMWNEKKPNKKFMKRHRNILKHWLNERSTIDSINDQFLSRLIFRIDEHTYIADSTNDTQTKLSLLLRTIENCQHDIIEMFHEILKSDTVRMEHVLDRLNIKKVMEPRQNEKRKSTSEDPRFSSPPKQQKSIRQNLTSEKEAKIIETLQSTKGENVKETFSKLDLVYEKSMEGSIIIQLKPKSTKALHKLKTSCRNGSIKDYVPDVYSNNVSDMEEGEYLLTLKIFLLPTPPYSNDDKKVIFHLQVEESISIDIQDSSKLLCQELEITDKLLTILQQEGIVSEDIKREISKMKRRNKIQHVLDKISMHGVKGYNILKDYIETVDKTLYENLTTIEKTRQMNKSMRLETKVSGRPQSASQENRKELFYTTSLLLVVKKTAIDDEKGGKVQAEMTCEKVISSECYFTEDGKHDSDSEEEFHSLNDNWVFDNALQENKGDAYKLDEKRKLRDCLTEAPQFDTKKGRYSGLKELHGDAYKLVEERKLNDWLTEAPQFDTKKVPDTPAEYSPTLAESSSDAYKLDEKRKLRDCLTEAPQFDTKKVPDTPVECSPILAESPSKSIVVSNDDKKSSTDPQSDKKKKHSDRNKPATENTKSDPPRCQINEDAEIITNDGNQRNSSPMPNPFDYKKNDKERFNKPTFIRKDAEICVIISSRNSGRFRQKAPFSPRKADNPDVKRWRYEVAIVKSYGLLKEELQMHEAEKISRQLFPEDTKLICDIKKTDTKRRAVDFILKRVLDSTPDKQEQFIEVLTNVKSSDVLLQSTDFKVINESDVNQYRNIPKETAAQKWTFSTNDYETLKNSLKDCYIDKINDEFLSKFYITVCNHSTITQTDCVEEKAKCLIEMMYQCEKAIYSVFKKMLLSLRIGAILQNLEIEKQKLMKHGKREHISGGETDTEIERSAKKLKIDETTQQHVVYLNKRNGKKLKGDFEEFGLTPKEICIGSIMITFSVESATSWEKLKQYCTRGEIGRLVKEIFNHEGMPENLKDGEFDMTLTIYESKESTSDYKKGILVLDATNTDEDIPDNPVTTLLLEELDITQELLKFLKETSLADNEIESKIKEQTRRKSRVECLLRNILEHDKDGYTVLGAYIEDNDKRLYKRFVEANDDMKLDSAVKQSSIQECEAKKYIGAKFYQCTAVFGVKTDESGEEMDSSERNITCLKVNNSRCFFGEPSEASRTIEKRSERSFDGEELEFKKLKSDKAEERERARKERLSTLRRNKKERSKTK